MDSKESYQPPDTKVARTRGRPRGQGQGRGRGKKADPATGIPPTSFNSYAT